MGQSLPGYGNFKHYVPGLSKPLIQGQCNGGTGFSTPRQNGFLTVGSGFVITVNGNAGGEQWLRRRGLVWVIKQTEGKNVNSVINWYKNNGAF